MNCYWLLGIMQCDSFEKWYTMKIPIYFRHDSMMISWNICSDVECNSKYIRFMGRLFHQLLKRECHITQVIRTRLLNSTSIAYTSSHKFTFARINNWQDGLNKLSLSFEVIIRMVYLPIKSTKLCTSLTMCLSIFIHTRMIEYSDAPFFTLTQLECVFYC